MQDAPLYDNLWNYGKPAETAVKFRDLLPEVKASGDQNAYLQLLTQLARTQSLQRNFDEAHTLLDQVEQQLTADFPIVQIRYWLERGRAFNSNKQPQLARPLFINAFELAKQIGADFYAVDAAHMMGIVGETPEVQMDWHLTAVSHAEQSKSPTAQQWLGSLYNNIGWTYHDQGKFEQAFDMFERCEQFFRQIQPNESRARIARWSIARTLRSLGQLEEALAMQQAQHAEYQQLDEEDGYVHEELGECLWALGREAEARPHFAEAYRILSQDQWLQANESNRVLRLKALGSSK